MGWQPIETAPKKGLVRQVKCGKSGLKEVSDPVVILASTSDGKITFTYWVEKQERWNMFSKNTPPTHWMPLPEPPSKQ